MSSVRSCDTLVHIHCFYACWFIVSMVTVNDTLRLVLLASTYDVCKSMLSMTL